MSLFHLATSRNTDSSETIEKIQSRQNEIMKRIKAIEVALALAGKKGVPRQVKTESFTKLFGGWVISEPADNDTRFGSESETDSSSDGDRRVQKSQRENGDSEDETDSESDSSSEDERRVHKSQRDNGDSESDSQDDTDSESGSESETDSESGSESGSESESSDSGDEEKMSGSSDNDSDTERDVFVAIKNLKQAIERAEKNKNWTKAADLHIKLHVLENHIGNHK